MRTMTVDELLRSGMERRHEALVYVVRNGATVIYVGRSINLVHRMRAHLVTQGVIRKYAGDRDTALAYTVDLWSLEECREIMPGIVDLHPDTAEAAMIRELNPVLNMRNRLGFTYARHSTIGITRADLKFANSRDRHAVFIDKVPNS